MTRSLIARARERLYVIGAADLPARPHLLAGVIGLLAVSIGWWVLPEAPAKRALVAVAVSVASWEAASPCTWRKLWPGAARIGL